MKKRFEIHVYSIDAEPKTIFSDDYNEATGRAWKEFERDGVYKVKVWDKEKGEVIPNSPNAPGLILELK